MAIIKRSTTTIIGLDTIVSDLNTAISTEATARANADGVLANLVTTVKTNLFGALNEVKSALDSEVSSRQAGSFTAISWNFGEGYSYNTSSNSWSLNAGYNTTVGGLSTAFSNLNASIRKGKEDSANAFSYLNTRINNVLSNIDATALDSLTEIVTAFQAADSTLNGAITTLATNSSNAITAEATARADADTVIKNALVAYASNVQSQQAIMGTNIQARLNSLAKSALNLATWNSTSVSVSPSDPTKLLVTYSGTYFIEKTDVLNFQTVRTIIDGQTFDVVIDDLSCTPLQGNPILNSTVVTLTFGSSVEAASFASSVFVMQFLYSKAFDTTLNYPFFDATNNSQFPTINTASTPWGALIQ